MMMLGEVQATAAAVVCVDRDLEKALSFQRQCDLLDVLMAHVQRLCHERNRRRLRLGLDELKQARLLTGDAGRRECLIQPSAQHGRRGQNHPKQPHALRQSHRQFVEAQIEPVVIA